MGECASGAEPDQLGPATSPADRQDAGLGQRSAARRLAALLGLLDPAQLAAVISLLPAEALLAVQLGVDVALDRADAQFAAWLREDAPGGRWHRLNPLPDHTALDEARYPPHGDRTEWITYGPAGQQAAASKEAA